MGKDSHFTGQPVYSQVLKLLDKTKIRQISHDTQGSESYVKRFGGYEHLVVMLFGVLKHFDSLCELEIGMKAEAHNFFYGDSVNAIQIPTWCVLIANLLITVLSRSIKRKFAFSQVVTMIRLTLMYYINFISFMENPDKTWDDIIAGDVQKAPPQPMLFG